MRLTRARAMLKFFEKNQFELIEPLALLCLSSLLVRRQLLLLVRAAAASSILLRLGIKRPRGGCSNNHMYSFHFKES